MTFLKQIFIFISLLFVCGDIIAQKEISGNVIDSNSEPLIGATVQIKNKTAAAITDIDGNFKLKASKGDILVVKYLGYDKTEVKVDNRLQYKIILKASEMTLDDVVVVGYGTQKKVNLTGAVSTVDYSKLSDSRPITTTASALSGMNAGVMVRQTDSKPGDEGVAIKIRGVGTLNNSSPLVIVDGFEGSLGNVNPSDIKTISILKDAASCAIYGNRGANGVILITTKTGNESKKPSVSYSSLFAYNEPAKNFKLISDYADYMDLINESSENVGTQAVFSQDMIDLWREKSRNPNEISESGYPNYVAYPNTDWVKAMYDKKLYQKHSASVSGSNNGVKYLLSASYMDNPGIVNNTGYKRFQYRANISTKINKSIEIGTKIWGYEGNRQISDFDGASGYLSRAVPGIYPYYDGKFGWMENPEQSTSSRNNLYFFNRVGGKECTSYLNTAFFANIDLPFGIKYNVSYNFTRSNIEYNKHINSGGAWSFRTDKKAYSYDDLSKLSANVNNSYNKRWDFVTNATWNHNFNKMHDVGAMVGFEALYSNAHSNSAKKTGFSNSKLYELSTITELTSIDGSQSDYSAASFFGRLTYSFKNRYLLETNLRYDGSSRFARESRWGFFPSVSAAWRISEEKFMEHSNIDNLKLRVSWGKLGNNSIGNYDYLSTYTAGLLYSFGNTLSSGYTSTLSNNKLKWETTTSKNLGLDLGVLNNRLTLELDLYDKLTSGILYKAPVYGTIGSKSAPYQNLCEVTNKGYEITLGWKDMIKDFSYNVSVNFSRNYNTVSKYKGTLNAGWVTDADGFRTYDTNIGNVSTVASNWQRTIEGKLINEAYLLNVYSGNGTHFNNDGSVNPMGGPKDGMIRTEDDMKWLQAMIKNGAVFLPNKTVGKNGIWYGDIVYADVNGDGVYGDQNDYTFQNVSLTPKYYFGMQMDCSWKNFDFSVALAGSGGNSVYWRYAGFNSWSTRADLSISKDIAYDHYFYDPENPEDPRTNITSKNGRLTMNNGSDQSGSYSTQWLYKLDYLRVKNVSIGYSLPKKLLSKVGISGLRVYLSGENLFTFSSFPGVDPEYTSTTNYYAALKQYAIGLNLNF